MVKEKKEEPRTPKKAGPQRRRREQWSHLQPEKTTASDWRWLRNEDRPEEGHVKRTSESRPEKRGQRSLKFTD